jgi:transposase
VVQAKALLLAADGVANEQIARRFGVDSDTVRRWRSRFAEQGPVGIGVIAKGRGRKSSLPPGRVAEVVRLTMTETPADGSTHWTTRSMAARVGVGKDVVARIWADHDLKPWKVGTFKVSNDPRFEEKRGRRGRGVSQSAGAGGGVQLRRVGSGGGAPPFKVNGAFPCPPFE